jgi:hypothetical protein
MPGQVSRFNLSMICSASFLPEPAREAMNRACAEIEAQARRTEIMMIKTVAPAGPPLIRRTCARGAGPRRLMALDVGARPRARRLANSLVLDERLRAVFRYCCGGSLAQQFSYFRVLFL